MILYLVPIQLDNILYIISKSAGIEFIVSTGGKEQKRAKEKGERMVFKFYYTGNLGMDRISNSRPVIRPGWIPSNQIFCSE